MEDHATKKYEFPDGTYYRFGFKDDYDSRFSVDSVFEILNRNNIKIKEAWFKRAAGGCAAPGSITMTETMVRAGFVVRLFQIVRKIEGFGFQRTSEPDLGECSYYVRHYHFSN
jgi:hypothetical protein